MFHAYHSSIAGAKHEICEDYSERAEFEDCLMTVIADGVGSAELPDVGSKTIAKSVIGFFSKGYEVSLNKYEAINLLKKAYFSAYDNIVNIAEKESKDRYCYDSTISAVIITSNYVIWGHCGDGAIFKINTSGMMFKITCEQTGDFSGEVYAFLSGEKYWSFGITSLSDSYAFIMCTDGILEFLKLILKDLSNKFIYNIIQNIQKREFENSICNDFIREILSLKTIGKITSDDKTLAIILSDQISLRPNRIAPNPIIYVKSNNYYINYKNDAYHTKACDIIDINKHNFIINEVNSKMITNVPLSNRISLMQVIYPLRDVEIILDPNDGTKKAIQLVHYIFTRTIFNYEMLDHTISNSETYETTNNYKYYFFSETEQNTIKENFLIVELNDYDELIIKLYLFKNYFLFDFIFPDDIKLSIDHQMWSYSYSLANSLLKTMYSVRKNICSLPKPDADYIISLRKQYNAEKLTE